MCQRNVVIQLVSRHEAPLQARPRLVLSRAVSNYEATTWFTCRRGRQIIFELKVHTYNIAR